MSSIEETSQKPTIRFGMWASAALAVLTLITFAAAMFAVPVSGANCPADCIEYPYLDSVQQYPRDFIWMYLAVVMILFYLMVMAVIHHSAAPQRKIFSLVGLVFAVLAALLLAGDYFVQFSVVPPSLLYGETEGIPLLIQYNPHGIFIALEEFGYILMAFSFGCMAPVFAGRGRLGKWISWIFGGSAALVFASLAWITVQYGLDKLDRFEVLAISITWLALIVNGALLNRLFHRELIKIG